MFTVEELLKTAKDNFDIITICYSPTGHRLYKGPLKEVPSNLLDYYVGYVSANLYGKKQNLYIEIHERKEYWDDL